MLGDGEAVTAGGIDDPNAIAFTALEIDGVHAGAVAGDNLQPWAGRKHLVAHGSEPRNDSVTILKILY